MQELVEGGAPGRIGSAVVHKGVGYLCDKDPEKLQSASCRG